MPGIFYDNIYKQFKNSLSNTVFNPSNSSKVSFNSNVDSIFDTNFTQLKIKNDNDSLNNSAKLLNVARVFYGEIDTSRSAYKPEKLPDTLINAHKQVAYSTAKLVHSFQGDNQESQVNSSFVINKFNYTYDNSNNTYGVHVQFKNNNNNDITVNINGLSKLDDINYLAEHSSGKIYNVALKFKKFLGLSDSNKFVSKENNTYTINFSKLSSEQLLKFHFYQEMNESSDNLSKAFIDDKNYIDINLFEEDKSGFGAYVLSQRSSLKKIGDIFGGTIDKQKAKDLFNEFIEKQKSVTRTIAKLSNEEFFLSSDFSCGDKAPITVECIQKTESYRKFKEIAEANGLDPSIKDYSRNMTAKTDKVCDDDPNSEACKIARKSVSLITSAFKDDMLDKIGRYAKVYLPLLQQTLGIIEKWQELEIKKDQVKAYRERTNKEQEEAEKNRQLAINTMLRRRKALNL